MPLHWAVAEGNAASVKLLLDAGANVNAKDKKGRTPSYWNTTHGALDSPRLAEEKKKIAKLLSDAQSAKKP